MDVNQRSKTRDSVSLLPEIGPLSRILISKTVTAKCNTTPMYCRQGSRGLFSTCFSPVYRSVLTPIEDLPSVCSAFFSNLCFVREATNAITHIPGLLDYGITSPD